MPMCFSDNRYTDDAHYIGGSLALVNFKWGAYFHGVLGSPPDPQITGPSWKDAWRERLRQMPPILAQWLEHQRFDGYWQRASVGLDYSRIQCPVYCVGGWEDGYNNSIARAMAQLRVPRKALIGPWAHGNPDAAPGPGLVWAKEEVRWWYHWLYGAATGIMEEPMFRFFMRERTASEVYPQDTPGHWVAEERWPSARVVPTILHMSPGRLSVERATPATLQYRAESIVGLQRIEWVPDETRPDLAREQSPDDARSVVFDSEPLTSAMQIVGQPAVRLRVCSDVPVAKLAVRLTEVTPEGKSWLVTYGVLNLTHRRGHESPTPLVPGEYYEVEIPLRLIAHQFRGGNRIRLAISESLWPLVWPSPQLVTLTLSTADAALTLPVRSIPHSEPPFTIPEIRHVGLLEDPQTEARVRITDTGAEAPVTVEKRWSPSTTRIEPIGTVVGASSQIWDLKMEAGQPNSCSWRGDFTFSYERPDWGHCLIRSTFELTSSAENFHLVESVKAEHGGEVLFQRSWNRTLRRDLM